MKKGIMLLILLLLLSMLSSCTLQTKIHSSSASPNPSLNPASKASAIPETPSPSQSKTGKTTLYYVFNNDGRACVVDSKGNIILPPKFAGVQILQQDNSPTLFFTNDGSAHIKDKTTGSNGGLYDTGGKRINETAYENAEPISGDLIDVSDKEYNHGIISFSGKEVIPCKYDKVNLCGGSLIAYVKINYNKNDSPKNTVVQAIDVYDLNGKLLRNCNITVPNPYYYNNANSNYEFYGSFYDNFDDKYIKFCNETGTYCGLMDIQFNIIVTPVWEKIEPCDNDEYIVKRAGSYGVIDSNGKEIIPLKFTTLEANYHEEGSKNDIAFTASSSDGYYSFDKTGKQLYHSDKYIYIDAINGVFIAKDTTGMEFAFDSEGKNVFAPSNGINWDSDYQLFDCHRNMSTGYNYTNIYYTKDRVELPPSKFDFCEAVSPDRFIVSVKQSDKTYYGICDRTGKLTVPAIYDGIEQSYMDENYLIFSLNDKYGVTHSGVMDFNGNIILPDVFDRIYEDSNEVYYAESGTICGLIDINGNWLYRTSKFDSIQD